MNTYITAQKAIEKAGSIMALAKLLGVTRQAVQQYRDGEIPAARRFQLMELRPEWFKTKEKQS